MHILLAALPLIVILVLMAGFRWGGSKAGAAGWITALLIAILAFDASPALLWWAQIQGVFRAAHVLYIIWGALLFFRVTEADGTLNATSVLLQRLSPERLMQVLLLAWGFTSFLQGVGGFGVPVAVVAPLLVTLGFSPLQAIVMASLGHGWAISFGSLGASYNALLSAAAIANPLPLAHWMAISLGAVCVMVGVAVLWVAGSARAVRRGWLPMLTMALAMALVQYATVIWILPNIAAMLGSLAGLIVGGVWARVRLTDEEKEHAQLPPPGEALRQLAPYLLLIGIILVINLIPPVKAALARPILQLAVPERASRAGVELPAGMTKGISIFGHPGAQLVYAGLVTLLLAKLGDRLPPGSWARVRQGVVRSGVKSTLGILAMMMMATTMQDSGMVTRLAAAMAQLAGGLYPLMAPFIGALGAFMTGSNTNSNVILGAFQQEVATRLHLLVPLTLAIHNAGAALGSVFAPAKIIVGASTVGLSGEESDALRQTARYGLLMLVALALLGFLAHRWVG